MKNGFKLILTIFISLLFITNVSALSIDKKTLTIEEGKNDTVTLSVNSEEEIIKVEFTLIYSSYDMPAEFFTSNNYTDETPNSIKHSIVLDKATSGKITLGTIRVAAVNNPKETNATVTIHSAKATTASGEKINLNGQTINVSIKKKEAEVPVESKVIDKNMLKNIESKLVKIDLKKDIFNYDIEIDDDILELDLKPIANDENTKVDISTQKIKELKDNKIIITTKLEDTEQVYIINVLVKKNNNKKEVIIDNSEFVPDKSYKNIYIKVIIALFVIFIANLLYKSYKSKRKRRKKKVDRNE